MNKDEMEEINERLHNASREHLKREKNCLFCQVFGDLSRLTDHIAEQEKRIEQYEKDVRIQTLMKERAKCEELADVVEEIAKGKGRYSLDPFTHARNTIDDMKSLAKEALASFRGQG